MDGQTDKVSLKQMFSDHKIRRYDKQKKRNILKKYICLLYPGQQTKDFQNRYKQVRYRETKVVFHMRN